MPIFNKRAQRAVIRHPKFYFFDPGVFHYLRPKGLLDRAGEMEGPALEGLAQHLRFGSITDHLHVSFITGSQNPGFF